MCVISLKCSSESLPALEMICEIFKPRIRMWCDVICCCHLRWERFLISWWETKHVSCLSLSRFQLRASLARVVTCLLAENSWMPSWTSALQLLQVKINSHQADQIWLDLLCHWNIQWKQQCSKPTSAFVSLYYYIFLLRQTGLQTKEDGTHS